MICEKCRAEGKRSKVHIGSTMKTLMAGPQPYYDEDGNYVRPPDPNTVTTEYRCSNGHRWAIKRKEGEKDRVVWGEAEAPEEGMSTVTLGPGGGIAGFTPGADVVPEGRILYADGQWAAPGRILPKRGGDA